MLTKNANIFMGRKILPHEVQTSKDDLLQNVPTQVIRVNL